MSSRLRFVKGLSDADLAEARLGDDLVTRACVVTVGACAVIGLSQSGLVEPGVAALDAVLVVACSGLARWTLRRSGLRPLRLVTWLLVGAWVTASALIGPAAAQPSVLLGTLLAGFIAATASEQDGTRRSTLVNVALGLAVLTLAAGVAPAASLAVPIGVAWPAALVALLRVQPRRERVRAGAVATARPQPRGGWAVQRAAVVPLVACLVLGLAGFAALHALRGQQGTGQGAGGFAGTELAGPAPDAASRLASATIGGALDLSNRGTLPDTELFTVPVDSAQLWRTGSLDRYEGNSWDLSRSRVQVLPSGDRVEVPQAPDDPLPLPAAPTRVDSVQALVPELDRVAAPGPVTSVQTQGPVSLAYLPDGGLIPNGDGPLRNGYVVTTQQRPTVGDPQDALGGPAGPGPAGADPSDPRWTQLPVTVPDRVRQLGVQLVQGQPDRVSAVRAVSDAIRGRATYTLDSPVPEPDRDAVDDFLFVSHQGFCEQFASAEVVLLRAAGIPARIAVGFAGGDTSLDPEVRVIRATDAHAWVEVWFPGHGWASSDPTAGAVLAGPGFAQVVRDWLARWWWLVLAVLACVGGTVLWLVRRRGSGVRPGPARPGPRRRPHPGEPELVAAFARLEAALAASGVARQPHESLAELARRPHPQLPAAALATLERLTFAARPPDQHECRAAAAQLDDAAARLL